MSVAIKKCKFYITRTEFHEFIIKLKVINASLEKVKAIVS